MLSAHEPYTTFSSGVRKKKRSEEEKKERNVQPSRELRHKTRDSKDIERRGENREGGGYSIPLSERGKVAAIKETGGGKGKEEYEKGDASGAGALTRRS